MSRRSGEGLKSLAFDAGAGFTDELYKSGRIPTRTGLRGRVRAERVLQFGSSRSRSVGRYFVLHGWRLVWEYRNCSRGRCRGCPHGPYLYARRKVGDRWEVKYVGR